jgi:hypothetical protein
MAPRSNAAGVSGAGDDDVIAFRLVMTNPALASRATNSFMAARPPPAGTKSSSATRRVSRSIIISKVLIAYLASVMTSTGVTSDMGDAMRPQRRDASRSWVPYLNRPPLPVVPMAKAQRFIFPVGKD